ncbi:MAG: hypothetical protein ACRC7B_02305, partial [Metamycoplasmataceae bacterium]
RNVIFRVAGFQPESDIDTETEKFNKQVNTKRADLTPVQATAMINGKDPAEALASLEILADIPTLAVGFEFIVTGATINTTTNTTIDVAITVSKTGTGETKNVIFRVAEFTLGLSVDIEAAKFNITVETKSPSTYSEVAAQNIQNAANHAAKLLALLEFVNSIDIPTLESGFAFEILTAGVDSQVNTTVNVQVRVFEEANPGNFKEVPFKVAGLTSLLEIQAQLFNKTVATTSPTTTSDRAAQNIQNAANQAAKLLALRAFVDPANIPTLESGFAFEIVSAAADIQVNTTVNIKIKVYQIANATNFEEVTFKVTGLTSRLETQAKKFLLTQTTSNASLKALQAAQNIDLALPSARVQIYNNLTRTDLPTLNDGFKFEILSADVNRNTTSRINVVVKIFETIKPENNKTITLQITDFYNLTALELEAMKFINTVRTKSTIFTAAGAKNNILYSSAQQDRKRALGLIAEVPFVESSSFKYEVKDVIISNRDPNEIYVIITVLQHSGTNIWPLDVTFPINGFNPAP